MHKHKSGQNKDSLEPQQNHTVVKPKILLTRLLLGETRCSSIL